MPGVPGVVETATSAGGADPVHDVTCSAVLTITATADGLSRVINTVERKNWTLLQVQFDAGESHHTLRLTAKKRRGDADHLMRHLSREVVVIRAELVIAPEN